MTDDDALVTIWSGSLQRAGLAPCLSSDSSPEAPIGTAMRLRPDDDAIEQRLLQVRVARETPPPSQHFLSSDPKPSQGSESGAATVVGRSAQ